MAAPSWDTVFAALGDGATAAAGAASTKRQRDEAGGSRGNGYGEKADLALKLATISAQKVRLLEAACFTEIPLNTDGDIYLAMQRATTAYSASTKGKKGHGLGPPDTFSCAALLMALHTACTEADKKVITDFLAMCPPGSKTAQRVVRVCRTEKMHSAATRRLILKLDNATVEELIVKHLEAGGCLQWHGPKPPGYLEAAAQKLLDA